MSINIFSGCSILYTQLIVRNIHELLYYGQMVEVASKFQYLERVPLKDLTPLEIAMTKSFLGIRPEADKSQPQNDPYQQVADRLKLPGLTSELVKGWERSMRLGDQLSRVLMGDATLATLNERYVARRMLERPVEKWPNNPKSQFMTEFLTAAQSKIVEIRSSGNRLRTRGLIVEVADDLNTNRQYVTDAVRIMMFELESALATDQAKYFDYFQTLVGDGTRTEDLLANLNNIYFAAFRIVAQKKIEVVEKPGQEHRYLGRDRDSSDRLYAIARRMQSIHDPGSYAQFNNWMRANGWEIPNMWKTELFVELIPALKIFYSSSQPTPLDQALLKTLAEGNGVTQVRENGLMGFKGSALRLMKELLIYGVMPQTEDS